MRCNRLLETYCHNVVKRSRCGVFVGVAIPLILTGIAFAAFPLSIDSSSSSFVPRDSDVGENDGALLVAEEQTVFNPIRGAAGTFEQQRLLSSEELVLMFWYQDETTNVLNPSDIAFARSIVDSITSAPGYEDVCYKLGSGECAPTESLLRFFYATPNAGCDTFTANGNNSNLLDIEETLLALIDPDADPRFCDANSTNCEIGCREPFESSINSFVSLGFGYDNDNKTTDSNGPTLEAYATKATIRFGLPLAGYDSPRDRNGEQNDKIDDFVRSIAGILEDNRDVDGRPSLRYLARATNEDYVDSIIFNDIILVVVSIFVVLLYMWFHTASIALASLGMLHIILSFPIAYLFTQAILDIGPTGLLNFMSLFIILGIGADDVFIFVDAWKQSEHALEESRGEKGSAQNKKWLEERLEWSYRRSAKAMVITSATTSAAFMLNLTSAIPTIQVFGLFTALMIIANYAMVVTYYPCAVLMWEQYLRGKTWPCFKYCQRADSSRVSLPSVNTDSDLPPESQRKASTANIGKYRPLERFFHNYWSLAVFKYRHFILAGFAIFVGVSIGYASQLSSSNEPTEFLPDDDFLQQGSVLTITGFKRAGFISQLRVVHGLVGVSGSNPYNVEALGNPVFDQGFDISEPSSQEAYIDLCQRLRSGPRVLNNEVLCPLEEFRDWVESNGDTFPVPQNEFYATLANFTEYIEQQFGPAPVYTPTIDDREDRDNENIGLDRAIRWTVNDDGTYELSYLAAVVNLTLSQRVATVELRPAYDSWEELMADLNSRPANAAATLDGGFQHASLWVRMETETTLKDAAVLGIGASLAIAFVVVLLSTRDVVITLLAIASIGGVVASLIATVVWIGWELDLIVSICMTILVGLSVDYVVHIAHAFEESDETSRMLKLQDALTVIGISVLSSSVTTILGAIVLVFAYVLFFQQFGIFIVLTILFSTLYAFGCFTALLAVAGTAKRRNDFALAWTFLRACCCCSSSDSDDNDNGDRRAHDTQRHQSQIV